LNKKKKQHAASTTSNSPVDTRTVDRVPQPAGGRNYNAVDEDSDLSDVDEVAYDSGHESDESEELGDDIPEQKEGEDEDVAADFLRWQYETGSAIQGLGAV
jgi:hypothetical protein